MSADNRRGVADYQSTDNRESDILCMYGKFSLIMFTGHAVPKPL